MSSLTPNMQRGSRCGQFRAIFGLVQRCTLCAHHDGPHQYEYNDDDPATAVSAPLAAVQQARESARVAELDLRAALAAVGSMCPAHFVLVALVQPLTAVSSRLEQLVCVMEESK